MGAIFLGSLDHKAGTIPEMLSGPEIITAHGLHQFLPKNRKKGNDEKLGVPI
jgi:hypothetical protein